MLNGYKIYQKIGKLEIKQKKENVKTSADDQAKIKRSLLADKYRQRIERFVRDVNKCHKNRCQNARTRVIVQ